MPWGCPTETSPEQHHYEHRPYPSQPSTVRHDRTRHLPKALKCMVYVSGRRIRDHARYCHEKRQSRKKSTRYCGGFFPTGDSYVRILLFTRFDMRYTSSPFVHPKQGTENIPTATSSLLSYLHCQRPLRLLQEASHEGRQSGRIIHLHLAARTPFWTQPTLTALPRRQYGSCINYNP